MKNIDTVVGVMLIVISLTTATIFYVQKAHKRSLHRHTTITMFEEDDYDYTPCDYAFPDQDDVPYDQETDVSEFERSFFNPEDKS